LAAEKQVQVWEENRSYSISAHRASWKYAVPFLFFLSESSNASYPSEEPTPSLKEWSFFFHSLLSIFDFRFSILHSVHIVHIVHHSHFSFS
jgi:hypothetical protein